MSVGLNLRDCEFQTILEPSNNDLSLAHNTSKYK